MTEIDLSTTDPDFINELRNMAGSEKISACFSCRTCMASCPITVVDSRFSPLRIIRMALFGMKEELLGNEFIWLCSGCYACQERCPQGVRITDFMTILKNMAVREGHMPRGVKAQRDIIVAEGRIYPIDEFDNKKRKKVGLPSLPTGCSTVKKLVGPDYV